MESWAEDMSGKWWEMNVVAKYSAISGNREFTDFNYRKLKKVYSIWVCMDSPENRKNTVTSYQMTEKNLIGSVKEPIVNAAQKHPPPVPMRPPSACSP